MRTPPHVTPTARSAALACRWRLWWGTPRITRRADCGGPSAWRRCWRRPSWRPSSSPARARAPRTPAAVVAAVTLERMGRKRRCCDDSASDDKNSPSQEHSEELERCGWRRRRWRT
jgi:hypothetical protein